MAGILLLPECPLAHIGGLESLMTMTSLFTDTAGNMVAQLVKNSPAMQETLVRFLGWEDTLEKG